MAKGDEKLAMNLLSRLNDLNDDLSDEPMFTAVRAWADEHEGAGA